MTSKVNGKTEILTPYWSETPKNNIETKIELNDYVINPHNRANFCGYWSRPSELCTFPSFLLVVAYKNKQIFSMYSLNDEDLSKHVPFEASMTVLHCIQSLQKISAVAVVDDRTAYHVTL